MAIDANPYLCDICGTHKKETNHWFLSWSEPGEYPLTVPLQFVVIPWNEEIVKQPNTISHLCGISCTTQWLGRQLQQLLT